MKLSLLQNLQFWLLSIAAALIALHLHLVWRSNNMDFFTTSLLFWLVGSALVWQKRHRLTLASDSFSSYLGAAIAALLIIKSINFSGTDIFWRFMPFLAVLSLSLLASGRQGLKQYWQELLLFGFISIPPGAIALAVNLSLLTAKFAAALLHLWQMEVTRQGVNIILPGGFIEVNNGCSGMALIVQLLGLALIFLAIAPDLSWKKFILPAIAILLAFSINGARVALMAVLIASGDRQGFAYWHNGTGSLIFSAIAVLIFAICCHFILPVAEHKSQNSSHES